MNILGAREVERAAVEKVDVLVGPGDLITPLAKERAADLGVRIVRADSPEVPAPAPPPRPAMSISATKTAAEQRLLLPPGPLAGSTVNALYRRGAPVLGGLRPDGAGSSGLRPTGSPPRVAVIGAGHVGSITTLRLAESDLFAEVVLVDVVDGLAGGVALDLWHSAGLAGFGTTIRGSTELADIAGVDYVIMTAGKPRKPGMTRTDLTSANADIVGPIADRIAELAPDAVVIMVANPLEEMTHLARVRTGFPAGRVLGMAGVLDSARFSSLVALTGICRPQDVRAYALGSHGPEMVIPLSQATVNGRPIRTLLDPATLQGIVDRTRDSGAEVVSLLKTGSAYFAPGRSAALMAITMAGGGSAVLACAVEPTGQYGLRDTRVGLPVRLGPHGLLEIVEIPLEQEELAALQAAASRLSERIREVSVNASGGVLLAR